MPTYEDQLAAYRAQLAQTASMTASSQAAPSFGQTAGLAFNTMMSDLAGMAAMVRQNPITPYVSDVAPAISYSHPSVVNAIPGALGIIGPGPSMRYAEYQMINSQYIADKIGSGASTVAATAGAVGAGGLMGIGVNTIASMLTPGGVASYYAWNAGSRVMGAVGTGSAWNIMKAGATSGMSVGKGLGGILAGSRIGGTLGMGIGAIGGGAVAGAGAIAAPLALSYAAEKGVDEMFSQIGARRDISNTLENTSWRYIGGKGFSKSDRRGIASSLVNQSISDRDLGYGDLQSILQQGTQLGMFNTVRDAEDFKKKFRELKEGVKALAKTYKTTLEEGTQLMAELKQGGFYTGASASAAGIRGAGLGYDTGFSAREMHEVGMRGAAMFRGTGISTAFGFQAAQQNLAAVKTMQQQGWIGQETINQMGGTLGAANQLTQGIGTFTQSPIGRGVMIALMGKGGGLDQGRLNMLIGGAPLGDVMARAMQSGIDPKTANAVNLSEMISKMNPMQLQAIKAASITAIARTAAPGATGDEFRNAFYTAATHQGMSVPETQAMWAFRQNAPELMNRQIESMRGESNRYLASKASSYNTFWERTGLSKTYRGILGGINYVSEGFSGLGYSVSDTVGKSLGWRDVGNEMYSGKVNLMRALSTQDIGIRTYSSRAADKVTYEMAKAMDPSNVRSNIHYRAWGKDLSRRDDQLMSQIGYGATYTDGSNVYAISDTSIDIMRENSRTARVAFDKGTPGLTASENQLITKQFNANRSSLLQKAGITELQLTKYLRDPSKNKGPLAAKMHMLAYGMTIDKIASSNVKALQWISSNYGGDNDQLKNILSMNIGVWTEQDPETVKENIAKAESEFLDKMAIIDTSQRDKVSQWLKGGGAESLARYANDNTMTRKDISATMGKMSIESENILLLRARELKGTKYLDPLYKAYGAEAYQKSMGYLSKEFSYAATRSSGRAAGIFLDIAQMKSPDVRSVRRKIESLSSSDISDSPAYLRASLTRISKLEALEKDSKVTFENVKEAVGKMGVPKSVTDRIQASDKKDFIDRLQEVELIKQANIGKGEVGKKYAREGIQRTIQSLRLRDPVTAQTLEAITAITTILQSMKEDKK